MLFILPPSSFSLPSLQNMPIYMFYFLHVLHRITLEIMTLQPKCEDVETAEGVAITVTGVAQVKHLPTVPHLPSENGLECLFQLKAGWVQPPYIFAF